MPVKLGTVAVEVNQHQVYPEGACLTLTVDWLAHNLGRDQNLPRTESEVRTLQLKGRMHYDLLNLQPEQQADFLFREFGLTAEETKSGRGFSPDQLVDWMFETGGAQLIAFWRHAPEQGKQASAHSVAVKIGMVMIEFYDANLGFISMPRSDFRKSFCDHLDLNYAHLRGKWVIQRVSAV